MNSDNVGKVIINEINKNEYSASIGCFPDLILVRSITFTTKTDESGCLVVDKINMDSDGHVVIKDEGFMNEVIEKINKALKRK